MAKKDDWMQNKWRPMMGWTYMVTCITDFIIFPVMWSVLQAVQGGQVTSQWNPITLQGAGLFHLAMGAVLGVAAWSRGREKLAGVASQGPYFGPSQVDDYDYGNNYSYRRPTPVYENRVFMSKYGKPGPVIEEPEL